jgi:hypothetical protein
MRLTLCHSLEHQLILAGTQSLRIKARELDLIAMIQKE